jgi:hypothetical protein
MLEPLVISIAVVCVCFAGLIGAEYHHYNQMVKTELKPSDTRMEYGGGAKTERSYGKKVTFNV